MSDVIDLGWIGRALREMHWIGRTLREVESEQRSLCTEQAILRQQLSDGITALLDRIGQNEALLATRFDMLMQRMDQTERSVQERLDRIEARLTPPA
jgi:predicted transcriptional regulator